MTSNIITHEGILHLIAGANHGKNLKITVLVLCIVLFTICAALMVCGLIIPDMAALIALGFLFGALGAFALIMNSFQTRHIRAILNKKYTLQEDTCIRKLNGGRDINDALQFQHAGRKSTNFTWVVRNAPLAAHYFTLFGLANVGDIFFVLRSSNGSILYVFNSKFWRISSEDFNRSGGTYFPK